MESIERPYGRRAALSTHWGNPNVLQHRPYIVLALCLCLLLTSCDSTEGAPQAQDDGSAPGMTMEAESSSERLSNGTPVPATEISTRASCRVMEGRGRICGYVTDIDGDPIRDAEVTFFRESVTGWSRQNSTRTNAGGWYGINEIAGSDGSTYRYVLQISHPDYTDVYLGDARDYGEVPDDAERLTLTASEAEDGADVVLYQIHDQIGSIRAISPCSRIDYAIDGRFALCALRDLATATPLPGVAGGSPSIIPPTRTPGPPDCPIEIEVEVFCPNLTEALLRQAGSFGPRADMVCEPDGNGKSLCRGTFNSADRFLGINQLYIEFQCGGGLVMETIVGYGGVCDPKGYAGERPQSHPPGATPIPLDGLEVTLHFDPDRDPADGTPVASDECHTNSTRPGPAATPSSGEVAYWNNWSALSVVVTPLPTAGSTHLPDGSASTTTDEDGYWGFLTEPGYCYAVTVEEPSISPFDPPTIWWSPLVGNTTQDGAVEDLDLTIYR